MTGTGSRQPKVAGRDRHGEDNSTPEEATCRRLANTVALVLRDILRVSPRNVAHPLGEPNKVFLFDVEGETSSNPCQVNVQSNLFTVSCGAPFRVPPDQRGRVAEYLARINFKVGLGHLAMDFSDGEVCFRVVHHTLPALANEPLVVARIFEVALHAMDAHVPLIFAVAFGGMSPEHASQCHMRAMNDQSEVCRLLSGGR